MLIPPKTVFFEDGDRKDDHTDEYDEDGDYVDKDDEGGGRSKVKHFVQHIGSKSPQAKEHWNGTPTTV